MTMQQNLFPEEYQPDLFVSPGGDHYEYRYNSTWSMPHCVYKNNALLFRFQQKITAVNYVRDITSLSKN